MHLLIIQLSKLTGGSSFGKNEAVDDDWGSDWEEWNEDDAETAAKEVPPLPPPEEPKEPIEIPKGSIAILQKNYGCLSFVIFICMCVYTSY